MAGSIPAARQHLIDKIAAQARGVSGRTVVPLDEFVRTYYRGVDEEDLRESDARTLAAAAAGHLAFGATRRGSAPLVRVFNPDPARDGWQCPHTVVEVVANDSPFLVDSLSMVMNECGLAMHLVVHPVLPAQRDRRGRLTGFAGEAATAGAPGESWQHIEIDRVGDPGRLAHVRERILTMLEDLRLAVADWKPMEQRAREIARDLADGLPGIARSETAEAAEFLDWLADRHFTLLGYREYRLARGRAADRLIPVGGSGLGLLRTGRGRPRPKVSVLAGEFQRLAREPSVLIVTKANAVSTVHRASYLDYVGVKRFDRAGRVVGERRFIGLFTSMAYSASPRDIPLLRHKVRRVIDHISVAPDSHDGKALMHVLERHPRDELFQASVPELVRTARGVVNLYDRRRVRLFVRRDPYRRFYSCLLYVPRDRYNTQARERIESILLRELGGTALESRVEISESTLARLHTLVRTDPGARSDAEPARVERMIAEAVRTWDDRLQEALLRLFPEDRALALSRRFSAAFPAAYQEDVAAQDAIADIELLASLPADPGALSLALRPGTTVRGAMQVRLYRRGEPVAMSDVLPLLENFDLRVLNERPYRISAEDGSSLWIQALEVTHAADRPLDPAQLAGRFGEAFFAAWEGRAESDGFDRLVIGADLVWREVLVLRAIARYLVQTGLPASQQSMESVLARHPAIAARLAWLFEARFDPAIEARRRAARIRSLVTEIDAALEQVTSPNDDRILRSFRSVVDGALRTNHFQPGADGRPKTYLSIKLDPKSIPELPKPRPMFEVWVYSPRVEGVHLRMGRVARGGIRWSDRHEDFRTEILGLMKAQNVKNTLIVPVGAKGGFVPKRPPSGDRDAVQKDGVECYRTLIRGLLDLTDNIVDGAVVPPAGVVRHDPDDPYLVVAADKGTASFSDIANALSAEYGFWLGDAFASGGSAGYDHKKMGITARGAWECVKRNFREMGVDIQAQDFTVAGIGDMSGDVFGNGMLLSRHIRLLAAFNHQHILLDPDPDAERSFRERERLFGLARSSWADYDTATLSRGGGVFPRDAKEIALSPQARAMLGIDEPRATPQQVIRAILTMPVDLLWNGGIGTYVKASWEANSAVGDRTNDAVRVDGRELRCRVIGEGGNLGLSQLGRIEYAAHGGRLNTDFVDNSGGVDCSDHEVNIKIMLATVARSRPLRTAARNRLLSEMTDDVAALVLRDNYLQSQAISLLQASAAERLGEHAHLIRALELDGLLDRGLEFLPSPEEIEERRKAGRGLTRPELAMLLAYSKIALNGQLQQSDVAEDPYLSGELGRYFPERLSRRYGDLLGEHRLRREIICTATTNSIVNRMGPTFVMRACQDTGADAAAVARAYAIAREAFDVRALWGGIESLDNLVAAATQYAMTAQTVTLLRHVSYWLLQRHRGQLGIEQQVARLRPALQELYRSLPAWLAGLEGEGFAARRGELVAAGVPADLARHVAALAPLQCAPDIVELAQAERRPVGDAARTYFAAGSRLGLDWLRSCIESLDIEGHWHAVARGSLRDGVGDAHRRLVQRILHQSRERDPERAVANWMDAHAAEVAHARGVIEDIRSQGGADFASLSVALQAMSRLADVGG